MQSIRQISPLLRAIGVIGVVAVLVTSITFAALSSTASLTGTTISSATASLLVWDGDSFESTGPGFTVTDLVPGDGSGDLPFFFKNDSVFGLDITATVPIAPTLTNVDSLADVEVKFTNDFTDDEVTTDLAALTSGDVTMPGNPLAAGATGNGGVPNTEGNYFVEFDLDPTGVSGSSASVGAFDIVFTGTQVVTP